MAAPRKEDIRAKIMQSAKVLLGTKPFAEISLAEIAGSIGISKGTLYYHFHNKNELLLAITDEYLDSQWEELIAWTENADKDTSMPRLIKYVLERDAKGVQLRIPLFYDAILGNEAVRTHLLKRYDEFARLLTEKISRRTDIVDGTYLAWLLLLLSDGLSIHESLKNDQIDTSGFIRQTAAYITELFG